VFEAVAGLGSLSRAAEELDVNRSVVGHQLRGLEMAIAMNPRGLDDAPDWRNDIIDIAISRMPLASMSPCLSTSLPDSILV
jgi:hypothetical protein